MTICSELMSLKNIVEANYFFRVPIYQRLYVWGDEQVKMLLADLLTAYKEAKELFYLGAALVVEQDRIEDGRCFDLIDGQQRFTTLWMMSLVWQQSLTPFLYRQEQHTKRPRISFSIRPEVDHFFAKRMAEMEASSLSNSQLIDALAIMQSFIKEDAREIDLADFTRFVFEKVQLVLTCVPTHTDLNKLFEVINNRGVQLQYHEILKAWLLSYLPDNGERERYAHLWDACSHMGNYVEKNLKEMAKLKVATLFSHEASKTDQEPIAKASKVLDALSQLQSRAFAERAMSLEEILSSEKDFAQSESFEEDDEVYESDDVRSIISFPMLLQHTLRIWLHQNDQEDLPKILDKELLSLFESHFLREPVTRHQVTSFIDLLWEIRYCFDKHVIKWVRMDEEEHHLICSLRLIPSTSKGKTYYSLVRQQSDRNEGFALLQSMLYHSQQITTHYWLTPLLAYMHDNPGNSAHHFAYLRHLDNHLLCSTDDRPLIERTRRFLDYPWQKNILDYSVLYQDRGVTFPHYWFYKLEFILWELKQAEMQDPRWEAFRMTAKNSIEHISPQTPQKTDTNRLSTSHSNRFGNLVLVSRSVNSEYGNLPFNEKRQRFLNRNGSRLDSLKMALIYQHHEWNDSLADQHQQQMIALVAQYLDQDERTGPEWQTNTEAVSFPKTRNS